MAKIYSFTEEEKEIINFLKNIVTVKYGSYKNFKLKKEKYIIQKRIYKTVVLLGSDNDFLRHFSANCNTGFLHMYYDVSADSADHRNGTSHYKS